MGNFFNLVEFEYKKLFKRKGTVITIILITLFTIISPVVILLSNIYIDGELLETGYEAMLKDRKYAIELSGRSIDETLFMEVKESYLKIPLERYGMTMEYEQYGRSYSQIYGIMRGGFGNLDIQSLQDLTLEEMQDFYQIRHERVVGEINALNISDHSKEKLIQLDNKTNTPWIFDYIGGYQRFFAIMYSTGVFMAFAIAVCIAPVFAGEYSMSTSQIILSSKFGKNKLIIAKLFTAISFCITLCLVLTILTYLVCGVVYGFNGGDAPLQLYRTFPTPYPLTMMEAAVIFSVSILFGIILVGMITLFLSSKFKSAFSVIIIVSLLIFVPLMIVNVSYDNMLLYNLFRLLPTNMMGHNFVFSYIPYEIFGLTILPYMFIPVFVVLFMVIIIPFTWKAFKNHQIV